MPVFIEPDVHAVFVVFAVFRRTGDVQGMQAAQRGGDGFFTNDGGMIGFESFARTDWQRNGIGKRCTQGKFEDNAQDVLCAIRGGFGGCVSTPGDRGKLRGVVDMNVGGGIGRVATALNFEVVWQQVPLADVAGADLGEPTRLEQGKEPVGLYDAGQRIAVVVLNPGVAGVTDVYTTFTQVNMVLQFDMVREVTGMDSAGRSCCCG